MKGLSSIVTVLLILHGSQVVSSSSGSTGGLAGIWGSIQRCENEGEAVQLPDAISNPCYTCLCKEGRVECEKQQCPSLQGCFLIVLGQKQGCCDVCKACKHGNKTIPSGTTEHTSTCTKSTCNAGVLTHSKINCHVPCKNPIAPVPGSCCPTCPTCSLNGKVYEVGTELYLPEDPCVRCKCGGDGSMSCSKASCPVLACPPGNTYLEKGECCPKCNGSRTRFIPKQVCLLGDKAYPNGTSFRLDTCTNCTCVGNTAICERVTCPILECEESDQVIVGTGCCKKCKGETSSGSSNKKQGVCVYNDRVYTNAERWDVNACQSCICDWGKTRCTEQMCRKNVVCPYGYKLKNLANKCCPECVGEDGVCSVFGDPHYRSFDGRVFNFQGACKYLLTGDVSKTFAVRVKNEGREGAFSWTKTITLKVRGEGRVTLGQKRRVKFNGKRVQPPFRSGGLSIYMDGELVVVESGVGVKVSFDGVSYVEVGVGHKWRGKVSGLCGNFNGVAGDDFFGGVGVFGESWRVGGRKSCSGGIGVGVGGDRVKPAEPSCKRNWKARQKAEKMCSPLREFELGSVFSKCFRAVPVDRFFKSCTFDMCECPVGRKCHCEVFAAYARNCDRVLKDSWDDSGGGWRNGTGCGGGFGGFGGGGGGRGHGRRVWKGV